MVICSNFISFSRKQVFFSPFPFILEHPYLLHLNARYFFSFFFYVLSSSFFFQAPKFFPSICSRVDTASSSSFFFPFFLTFSLLPPLSWQDHKVTRLSSSLSNHHLGFFFPPQVFLLALMPLSFLTSPFQLSLHLFPWVSIRVFHTHTHFSPLSFTSCFFNYFLQQSFLGTNETPHLLSLCFPLCVTIFPFLFLT